MRAQGRRLANGPVWADWFLELEELLEQRERTRGRHCHPGRRRNTIGVGGNRRSED